MTQIDINSTELQKILYHVEKPGRYVGGEHNQVTKDWDSVETHVALVFPDIYDLGVPNLGLAILYDILNKRPDVLAERAFAPWVDMEAQLREKHIPLFSLETKRPLCEFDIVGFTLPYESIYTNVLNILDLSGIPARSRERGTRDPLVIAGGQACFNPEPMANFIDAFVIGEGEEVILEVVAAHQAWRATGAGRDELLRSLSRIEGVYVPALYCIEYNQDGTIKLVNPIDESVPSRVTKRIMPVLPPPITDFIVPNVEIVHDRIAIEIMRGCTRGCRFCHAGMVNRPVRERSSQEITDAIAKGLASTGYEQVGLLSLSSSDHTRILELTQAVYERFHDTRVAVSLPSLRIASFSVDLMEQLQDLKPSGGFTFAPEAATERLRAVINKPLDEDVFYETVRKVFEHGWLSLKLYFMIGLPTETMEDVEAILEVGRKVQQIGKQVKGNRIRVHLGVGTFIPKPHTPFQWHPVDSMDTIQEKLDFLKAGTRKLGIKLSYNIPSSTMLEAWLSRGDKRLGEVIHSAWQNGAKFDAWNERFDERAWLTAFETQSLSPNFYAFRQKSEDEVLPWDHIGIGVTKSFLLRDLHWSQEGKTRPDCRTRCFYCGILDNFEDIRPSVEEAYWGCPE